ncbi:MAG: 4-carboxymuconolactone decarboxylase [Gammaproteobacteria bacterium]|jgi:4-carboxymuconolactone decarboxylase
MSNSELQRKGMAMRTELLGEEFVSKLNQTTYNNPVMDVFRDIAVENVFGALWTRPGLDLKTRTLICVVSDTAMGRETELVLHLRMALRQGWTQTELTETMVHMSGYIGVPLVRGAMLVASKVFAEVDAERDAANN